MRATEHPTPALLTRFADGMASSAETRFVVRHLLAGCLQCSAVLGPTWKTVERLSRLDVRHPQLARRRRDLHP
jgi:hypothetical protein